MNELRFAGERAARWRELEDLLARVHLRRLGDLPGPDVRRLGALYRLATTDLAVARTLRYSDETVRSLNRLCSAAHGIVYGSGRTGATARAASFLATEFPRVFRSTSRHHAVAAGAFAVGCVATWALFSADPDLVDRTMGGTLRERAARAAQLSDEERRYLELRGAFAPVLAWGIIANNVRACLLAFGLGCATGVGGLLVVLATAATIGAGFAVFVDEGVPGVLGTFIAAHGPMELAAIFISTGAGMRVGLSLLLPGRRTRGAAFRAACAEALPLLLGCVALLVAAGLLEGLVSPGPLPAVLKWGIGAATTVFLVAWLGFAGRAARASPSPPPGWP